MLKTPPRCGPIARWRRRRRDRPLVFFSERYRITVPGTPIDAWRAERIVTALAQAGWLSEKNLRPAPAIAWKALARVHDADYLESLTHPDSARRAFGFDIGVEHQEAVLDAQRRMCHGTLLAAQAALGGRIGINLGGGLHHAEPRAGKGFCLVNDIAVAVAALREGGFNLPVLVVDLDLHDGDGTRKCFAADPTVHTFSIHNETWDVAPAIASTTIALGADVDDVQFLTTLEQSLPPVLEAVDPALVFYLAGVDAAANDRLGNWKLTQDGLFARDTYVVHLVRDRRPPRPLVVTLAGGYGHHAWRPNARTIGWLISGGLDLTLPDSDSVLVDRYLAVAKAIRSSELGGEDLSDDSFGLTEADILGGLDGAAPPRRFLDFYTPQGLELALERTGYLDRLRTLGYAHPDLEVEVGSPAGDTLRIFGDTSHRELLSELRLRRDRTLLPGATLLFVEWLMLQNPRHVFSSTKPRLPGQDYPGLGLLKDVVALLVAACRRLGLDGIASRASHYHLVRQSSKWFKVLDPRQADLVARIDATFAGVPLAEASRRLAAGPVTGIDGEQLRWEPITLVLPLTDRVEKALATPATANNR